MYIGTSNTLDARTVAAIELNSAKDFQVYYFLSLETGKHIHSKKWDVLSIGESVIDTTIALVMNSTRLLSKTARLYLNWPWVLK